MQTISALSDFPAPPPSCEVVLGPCVLMALMMLHAVARPLKVNALTSVVRSGCIDRQRLLELSLNCSLHYNPAFSYTCNAWLNVQNTMTLNGAFYNVKILLLIKFVSPTISYITQYTYFYFWRDKFVAFCLVFIHIQCMF